MTIASCVESINKGKVVFREKDVKEILAAKNRIILSGEKVLASAERKAVQELLDDALADQAMVDELVREELGLPVEKPVAAIDTSKKPVDETGENKRVAEPAKPSKPTASWIVKNKKTGEVLFETFDKKKVDALNTEKYEAVPIQDHLVEINKKIKAEKPDDGVALFSKSDQAKPAPEANSYSEVVNIVKKYAKEFGYIVLVQDSSAVSKSEYLYVKNKDGKVIKIRISDHADVSMQAGGASQSIKHDASIDFVGGDFENLIDDIVIYLAEDAGKKVPSEIASRMHEYSKRMDEYAKRKRQEKVEYEKKYLSNQALKDIEAWRKEKKDYDELAERLPENAKKRNAIYKSNEINDRILHLEKRIANFQADPNIGERFQNREWDSFNVGEQSTLSSALKKAGDKKVAAPKEVKASSVVIANTLAGQQDVFDRVRNGDITSEEFKSAFASVLSNKDALVAELSRMTKPQIFEKYPGLSVRYKNERKADVVDAAYDDMILRFTLGKTLHYQLGSYGSSGIQESTYDKAIRDIVEATTDETLAEYAASIKQAEEDRAAQRKEAESGMENPQTITDFKRILIAKSKETGITLVDDLRMMLPLEQRIQYDELEADASRSERDGRKESQKDSFIRAPGEAVATTEIIHTKHTKQGHDLWQFNFEDKVSKEEFRALAAQARTLGGNYSSYRGSGAIPGWQFRTEESAKAFKKLVAGDATEAKDIAQERRNAFADDKSQTAVERLTEMADALEEKADTALNQDRKENTHRRAEIAARAEAAANSDKALAKTMRNIAEAIDSGKANLLDRIRQKIQVETLRGYVNTAKSDMQRKQYDTYAEREKHKDDPTTVEVADHVTFPTYTVYRSDLANVGRTLLVNPGTKMLGQRIMKVADDVSNVYLKFAKENLNKVATFGTKDLKIATFSSKADANAAIARSNFRGMAIPLAVKRNEVMIILSPSEAIKRGVWEGDNDKRITLNPRAGADIVEKLGKAARRENRATPVPWQFENAYENRKRLAGMGIETPAELRTALREFISLQEAPKVADKIKKLERAMIGRKNDGLDFFPTSAVVADEMIESANIEEGMSVLEPSAGMGHIADRIREAGVEPDVVEMAGDRRELLEAKGYNLADRDFMDVSESYDRIIMNPPFSDRRDAEHVQHAYELLKPGGRLVALMGEGVFFGSDKKASGFRDWLDSVGGTEEKIDDGAFMDPSLPVNTSVAARMVVIDKYDDAPQLMQSRSGDYALENPFYSQLSKAIEKTPERLFVTGKQFALWLKSNAAKLGVKKAEIEAVGITDWLETQKKVSKSDVQAFLDANGVQVEDVVLGDEPVQLQKAFSDKGIKVEWNQHNEEYDYFDKDGDILDFDELPKSLQSAVDTASDDGSGDPTKFAKWQLPGGENYRELLLTLPERGALQLKGGMDVRQQEDGLWNVWDKNDWVFHQEGATKTRQEMEAKAATDDMIATRSQDDFRSSHFTQPNILAHIRFNERVDADGFKVLFIEEIQSDWGQKGRGDGFKQNFTASKNEDGSWLVRNGSGEKQGSVHADSEAGAIRLYGGDNGVPLAPFVTDTKSWTALALKRMIAYAAENGFDKVAWTTGGQQAERYDLSKQIKQITVKKNISDNGTWDVKAYDLNDHKKITETISNLSELEDYIGKEAANAAIKQVEETGSADLRDQDLKVGGEGMKGYYDQIVPQVANDIMKKLGGGKVGSVDLKPYGDKNLISIDESDAAESIEKGDVVYGKSEGGEYIVLDEAYELDEYDVFYNESGMALSQPSITITPALRDTLTTKGLPLFSTQPNRTPTLSVSDVERATKALRNRWIGFQKIKIVNSVADVDPETMDAINSSKGGVIDEDTEGIYDAASKTVYLFADNISDADRAAWVAIHEVVGHGGIRMLGAPVSKVLDRAATNGFVKQLGKAIAKERKEKYNNRAHTDEAIAELAAATITGNHNEILNRYGVKVPTTMMGNLRAVIQRVIDAVRKFLSAAGDATDEQIMSLLATMKKAVEGDAVGDPLYNRALYVTRESTRASASMLMRNLNIDKSRAERLITTMQEDGYITFGENGQYDVTDKINTEDILYSKGDRRGINSSLEISQNQTDTPAFKKWFGDSKVVDENGKPLVVYHGTGRFVGNEFVKTKKTNRAGNYEGFYFSPEKDDANHYMEDWRNDYQIPEGAQILPVYLAIKNPYIADKSKITPDMVEKYNEELRKNNLHLDGENVWFNEKVANFRDSGRLSTDALNGNGESMTEVLKAGGYDGAKDGRHWIAFSPTQIKSAIGNRGTFDENDANILHSTAPSPKKRSRLLRMAKAASLEKDTSLTDKVVSAPFKLIGWNKIIEPQIDRLLERVGEFVPEKIKAGMIADYGLGEEYVDRKSEMKAAEAAMNRKSAGMVEMLAGLTRAESRVAYQWMQVKPSEKIEKALLEQLPEESRKTLDALKKLISSLGEEAVRLGQMSNEAFQRNNMAYLHRTYAKHVLDNQGVISRMMRARALKIKGNQYKGRGIFDEVNMSDVGGDPMFWRKTQEGKADKSLVGKKVIRFERRDASTEAMDSLPGMESKPLGRLREVVFWPSGQAIPDKFGDWVHAGAFEVRSTKGDKLVVWRDFTPGERQRMGELDEVRYAVAQTLQMMVHDVEVGRFFEWTAKKYGKVNPDGKEVVASESMLRSFGKDEWVQVPSSNVPNTKAKKYGTLAGLYIPATVWNDIRQTSGVRIEPFGRTHEKMLQFWKKSKTAWSPAVHMNNVMANFVIADWHDLRAVDLTEALKVWSYNNRDGYRELYQRFEDSGALGGMFLSNEAMRDEIKKGLDALKSELIGEHEANKEMNTLSHVMHLITMVSTVPVKGAKKYAEKMEDLYHFEDSIFRLAAFVKAVRYGKSDIEAGRIARHSFLNYDINAPWIQAARHTFLPFISFFYRALPMALKTLKSKPWKVLKLLAFYHGVSTIGAMLAGGDDEEERKLLPENKGGNVWGVVPKMIRMPWNHDGDEPIYLDIRRWVPVGDLADMGNSTTILPPWATPGGLVPLLGEMISGYSLFTGKKFVQETDTFTEDMEKRLDYLFKGMLPNVPLPNPLNVQLPSGEFNPLGLEQGSMQSYAWSGIEKSISREENRIGEVRTPVMAGLNAIGVKVGAYPKENMRANRGFDVKSQASEIKANMRRAARNYDKLTSPTKLQTERYERTLERQREKLRQLADQ